MTSERENVDSALSQGSLRSTSALPGTDSYSTEKKTGLYQRTSFSLLITRPLGAKLVFGW